MIVYLPIISIPLIAISGYLFIQNREIKKSIDNTNTQYDFLKKDYSELQNENILTRHRLNILHVEFDNVLNVLTSISKEHTMIQDEQVVFKTNIQDCRDNISSLSTDLEVTNSKLAEIEEQVSCQFNYRNDIMNSQEQLKNQVSLMIRDVKDDISRVNAKLDI